MGVVVTIAAGVGEDAGEGCKATTGEANGEVTAVGVTPEAPCGAQPVNHMQATIQAAPNRAPALLATACTLPPNRPYSR